MIKRFHRSSWRRSWRLWACVVLSAGWAAAAAQSPAAAPPPAAPPPAASPKAPAPAPAGERAFFDEEVARLTRLAASGVPALQIEAAQGFYYLRHPCGEKPLLPLAASADDCLRLEVVRALTVCGGRAAVPVLIDRLDDSHWQIAQLAREGLQRMTACHDPARTGVDAASRRVPAASGSGGDAASTGTKAQWQQWLAGGNWPAREDALLAQLADKDPAKALAALEAIQFTGTARCEPAVIQRGPQLGREGVRATVRALERFGTPACLPLLASLAPHYPDACWALGQIGAARGGDPAIAGQVEEALLKAMARWKEYRLDAMINLDRIGSTRCEPFLPDLLEAFGLVIFRSYVDELQMPPTAFQHVAAKLILRTGKAQEIVDLVLQEAEGRRNVEQTPPPLRGPLAAMREELKPGFVRMDGKTVAQPLAALPHIIRDRRLAPRLIALLNHPAYIVRIYAAESLGALHEPAAVEPILKAIRQPYGFVDESIGVSGKHFGDSQIVRWRGYLCIALGKLGSEPGRLALEEIALNPDSFRDLRYGSVVGLGFLGSPKSLPALEQAAGRDIIWNIRQTARQAMEDIRLGEKTK